MKKYNYGKLFIDLTDMGTLEFEETYTLSKEISNSILGVCEFNEQGFKNFKKQIYIKLINGDGVLRIYPINTIYDDGSEIAGGLTIHATQETISLVPSDDVLQILITTTELA